MIEVRQAVQNDTAGLIEIARFWPTEGGSWVAPRTEDGGVDVDRARSRVGDPAFGVMVAIDDQNERIVGYAVGYSSALTRAIDRNAKLDEVMVSDDYRKQGIGTRLVRAFEEWARRAGMERCTLGGGPAPLFYEKLGWERYGFAMFMKRL